MYAGDGPRNATTGQVAAAAWFRERGLSTVGLTPWHVEVSFGVHDQPVTLEFDVRTDTRFRIEIYSGEWGVFFCHEGRASWIRVTDIAFVHGRDDFGLLGILPSLDHVSSLLRQVERTHAIAFRREHALIRTNVPNAEPAIRSWVSSL